MPRRNTRRKRKEALRRSASKAGAIKAANLLAYTERKTHEDKTWQDYSRKIQAAYKDYCPHCPLNLVCMMGHCPRDAIVCATCGNIFSRKMALVIRCSGFMEHFDRARPWQSGQCPRCFAYTSWSDFTVVEGFNFATPDIEAIRNIVAQYESA